MSAATESAQTLQASDFHSGGIVRWCPGCGDYGILTAVQATLAKLGRQPHEYAFVSGIGCSSRFPHYMSTYGFHTIHGRALAVATGVKASSPATEVWVITGDGDCLSIGGNHMIHALRRNVDVKVLLFNNRIYGLTKGQYSPTTPMGMENKTAPLGTIDRPINPLALALAAGASFVARAADNDQAHLRATLERAAQHKGTAFIEILQNCVIFYDKSHEEYYGPKTRKDRLIYLHEGEPMLYGASEERGLVMEGGALRPVPVTTANREQVLVHRESEDTGIPAAMLAQLEHPSGPVPMGVFRAVQRPTYDQLLANQVAAAKAKYGQGDLKALLRGSKTWEVS